MSLFINFVPRSFKKIWKGVPKFQIKNFSQRNLFTLQYLTNWDTVLWFSISSIQWTITQVSVASCWVTATPDVYREFKKLKAGDLLTLLSPWTSTLVGSENGFTARTCCECGNELSGSSTAQIMIPCHKMHESSPTTQYTQTTQDPWFLFTLHFYTD